jgi:hypothetical protein
MINNYLLATIVPKRSEPNPLLTTFTQEMHRAIKSIHPEAKLGWTKVGLKIVYIRIYSTVAVSSDGQIQYDQRIGIHDRSPFNLLRRRKKFY